MPTQPTRPATRPLLHPLQLLLLRHASTSTRHPQPQPPPARPYRRQTVEERAALKRPDPPPPSPQPRPHSRTLHLLSRYLNPFHEPDPSPTPTKPQPKAVEPEPRDPARGLAATTRFVKEGIIDPRYKAASRRWVVGITSLVLAIGLTPEVWRRTIRGEKRREMPGPKKEEGAGGKMEGAGEGEGSGKS